MSETTASRALPAPASRWKRVALVVVAISLGQALLYGPSLAGQKILLPLDLLGLDRVVVELVDMGAFEFQDCVGDLDGDGIVGFTDLLQVLAAWGPCLGCPEDLDGNGVVGFNDLSDLLAAWGPCP